MNSIPETIIRALCWTLLHSLWQGLILAVVAGGVMLLTKKARSATRYALLATLVIGFSGVSAYTFAREMHTPVAAITGSSHLATGVGNVASQGSGVLGQQAIGVQDQAATGVQNQQSIAAQGQSVATRFIDQMVQYFNAHASVVVVIWFIVFMARVVKLLSGLFYAQRVRHYQTSAAPAEWQDRLNILVKRLGISRPVRLLESALIKVPAAVGWLKPVILVPVGMLAQLPADQVESILLHELAHISRRDYLFNLLQSVIDNLFFFNPALLWVSSLIRTERENCCDDVAIRETRSRRRLIEALVSFHAYQQSARGSVGTQGDVPVSGYAMAFADGHTGIVKRVERIVRKRNYTLNAGERLLLMGGVLVLCGAFITINGERAAVPVKTVAAATKEVKILAKAGQMSPVTASMAVVRSPKIRPVRTPVRTIIADTTRPDTAATMTKADIDLLIKARDHGVTPEYIAELKKLGYTVSLEQAIHLIDHGVNADFIESIQKEGYGQISLEKAVRLIDHGVSADFIHGVKAEGFPKLTLEEAVRLIDHGVDVGFIRDWKKKTGSQLDLTDYIKLKDAGVDPS